MLFYHKAQPKINNAFINIAKKVVGNHNNQRNYVKHLFNLLTTL